MQFDVSVVIVNWNVCGLLKDCLASIYEQSAGIAMEVIVVDNASSDGSVDMIQKEFPGAVLIALDQNIGFAGANNVGIARSHGRNLLLLNPDTIILDNAIGKSLKWLDANPDVGVMGCQVLEDEDTIQQTCFSFPSPLNLLLDVLGITSRFRNSILLGRSALGGWDRRSLRDVPVVSGMFMLVPRRAIDQVGPMDERFFVYAEEADWCRRFWAAGWRCVFAPIAQIVHRDGGGKSAKQTSAKMYVQLQKSILLYIHKYHGVLGWMLAWMIYVTSMGLRLVAHGIHTCIGGPDTARHQVVQSWAALKFHLFHIDPCPVR